MGDRLWVGTPPWYVTSQLGQLSLTFLWDRKYRLWLAAVKVVMSPLPGGR